MGIFLLMKNNRLFIVLSFIVFIFCCCATLFWCVYPLKYKSQIIYYSQEYNLDCELVSAVICVESRFDKNSVSSSGASGLMQLMPTTYQWVKSTLNLSDDIFDVDANIEAGCFYLSYLINKYENVPYALACYNAGEGVVRQWASPYDFDMSKIQYPETKQYVIKVLRLKKLYVSRFN